MIDNMLFLARAENMIQRCSWSPWIWKNYRNSFQGTSRGMAQERGMRIETTAPGYLTADNNAFGTPRVGQSCGKCRFVMDEPIPINALRCNAELSKWLDIEVLNQGAAIGRTHFGYLIASIAVMRTRSHPDDSGGLGLAGCPLHHAHARRRSARQ